MVLNPTSSPIPKSKIYICRGGKEDGGIKVTFEFFSRRMGI